MNSNNQSWIARLRDHIRRMGLPYLILLISLSPVAFIYDRVGINIRNREQARLDNAVRDLKERVDSHFTDVSHILLGVRGLFLASSKVRPNEWNLFLDSVEFSESAFGCRDLGFALRVLSTNLATHLREERGNRPDYAIIPPRERAEYFPITFLRDRDAGDVRSLGWDPYSNAERRSAMDLARDTGDPIATATVRMTTPNGQSPVEGRIIYFPVYRDSVQPATVEERREKLAGFVFTSFAQEQIWRTIFPNEADSLLGVAILSGKDKRVVFETNPNDASTEKSASTRIITETPLTYFGQRWVMRTTTLPRFAAGSERYFLVIAVGGCLTLSLTLFLVAAAQTRGRVALQREKERLAVTLRSIADGVIATDTAGKIVLINHAAESITGWIQSASLGRPIEEVFSILDEKTREKLVCPAQRVLAGDSANESGRAVILVARDGSERVIAKSVAPIRDADSRVVGVALVFRDITEKRRLEAELLRSSKLESVGLLAGGIAHDFNNILSIVLGNISFCKMMSPPAGPLNERLTLAERGCLRARELTRQLLTFAKGGAPIRNSTSIQELIHESTAFAVRGSNVVCKHESAPELWPVDVDEGQISQVFNNLVINAVQAMSGGGTLSSRANNCVVTEAMGLRVRPGRYVHIVIEDTGCGIAFENLGRIFDPYFSTKEGGSGLGLATAYAIIQKHEGCITVESAVGYGTTFHIYLPASNSPASRRSTETSILHKGAGRILVMDDEPQILDLARASLAHLGYEVETAAHGGEAIQKFESARAANRPFKAVIMDLTIPGGMGGKEAIKRLIDIDPQVQAIVSSGYSHDPVMANYREFGFAGVVEKPYRVESLAKALASIVANN